MQLHRGVDKLKAAGCDLVIIGNGAPSFIEGFREQTKYDGPLYTDPTLTAYKAAELKRGVTKTLDPRALGNTIGAFMRGNRQGRVQGDAWQQGGTLVVATDGTVKWHQTSDRPGDNATVEQILAAL